jgi:hypothetical protein
MARLVGNLGALFLLAGTYAVSAYTGISRATKDLDVICKPSDAARILEHFKDLSFKIAVEDERWLGKVPSPAMCTPPAADLLCSSLCAGMMLYRPA